MAAPGGPGRPLAALPFCSQAALVGFWCPLEGFRQILSSSAPRGGPGGPTSSSRAVDDFRARRRPDTFCVKGSSYSWRALEQSWIFGLAVTVNALSPMSSDRLRVKDPMSVPCRFRHVVYSRQIYCLVSSTVFLPTSPRSASRPCDSRDPEHRGSAARKEGACEMSAGRLSLLVFTPLRFRAHP